MITTSVSIIIFLSGIVMGTGIGIAWSVYNVYKIVKKDQKRKIDDCYKPSYYSYFPRSKQNRHDDIIYADIRDAEKVLTDLNVILNKYGNVSKHDLYELSGLDASLIDNAYGWTDLKEASILRVSSRGWKIFLPSPIRFSDEILKQNNSRKEVY